MKARANRFKLSPAPQALKPGFTLIELLVTIGIIAVLMAILAPALQAARSQAMAVACQGRIRQWGLAFRMYADENQGRWISYGSGATRGVRWAVATRPFWFTTAKGRRIPIPVWDIIERGITLCPLTGLDKEGPFAAGFHLIEYKGSGQKPKYAAISYGFNAWLYSEQEEHRHNGIAVGPLSWGTSNVKGPANIPVLGDSSKPDGYPAHTEGPPGDWPWCLNRHHGRVNMLFMDWSVRKVGLKELWTLKWHREFDTAGPWTTAGGVRPEDWPEWMRRFKDY